MVGGSVEPRRDLVERATPLLPSGCVVRQIFIGQAAPSFAFFLLTYATGITLPWISYGCVAVTDDAIHVLESRKLSGGSRPRALVATLSRTTRLGPVSGRWSEVRLLDKRYWVHQRFHPQIYAADHDAGLTWPRSTH